MTSEPEEQDRSHWILLRDVVSFQLKLGLDGVRDVLLIPVSIVALLAGVIVSPRQPGIYFYRLLRLGQRSDRWINLFGEHDVEDHSSDAYIKKVESVVVDQYSRGGVLRDITDRTDEFIGRLRPEEETGPADERPPISGPGDARSD